MVTSLTRILGLLVTVPFVACALALSWAFFLGLAAIVGETTALPPIARHLDACGGLVPTVSANSVDPAHVGKLVHVVGSISTAETIRDDQFGVAVPNVLALCRTVEVYQWDEICTSLQEEWSNGRIVVKNKTYTYNPIWARFRVPSERFQNPASFANPVASFPAWNRQVAELKLGAYAVPTGPFAPLLIHEPIDPGSQAVPADAGSAEASPANGIWCSGCYYVDGRPQSPRIGDRRVRYTAIRPATFSMVAWQTTTGLETHPATNQGSITMVSRGEVPAAVLIANTAMEGFQGHPGDLFFVFLAGMPMACVAIALLYATLRATFGSSLERNPFIPDLVEAAWLTVSLLLVASQPTWITLYLPLLIGLFFYYRAVSKRLYDS